MEYSSARHHRSAYSDGGVFLIVALARAMTWRRVSSSPNEVKFEINSVSQQSERLGGEDLRRRPLPAYRVASQHRRGFTLLETLVVLVILGVLAGIAGFSLAAAPSRGTDDGGSAARERALRAGVPVLDSTIEGKQRLHLPDGRTVPTLPWTSDSMLQ